MTQVLLDYPWLISDTLNGSSPAWNILQSFDDMIKINGLDAVHFISDEQFAEFWRGPFRGTGSAWAVLGRIAGGLVSQDNNECEASPVSAVPDLSVAWKRSLRDAMHNHEDWRNPQIVISESRRNSWPEQHEISIQFEVCVNEPAAGPYDRVLVELDKYGSHPYAVSDCDPWDLRHIHPHQQINCNQNPCILPKPPELRYVALKDIPAKLNSINRSEKDKWYFIPPTNWDANSISKASWRRGRAFLYGEKNGRSGWIDERQFVWQWDLYHVSGHWNVQMDNGMHVNVSHTGEVFR